MSRAYRKPEWHVVEDVPQAAVNVAIRRCRVFIEAALWQDGIGQRFWDVLTASCYLQGVWDIAARIGKRTEGDYEQWR